MQSCLKNIDLVNEQRIAKTDAYSKRLADYFIEQDITLPGSQFLGIVDSGKIPIRRKDYGSSYDRPGQRTATSFIDTCNGSAAATHGTSFERQQVAGSVFE